jgi:hypothetical protein
MTAELITIIGIIGAGMVLLAFIMVQTKKWSSESFQFDLVNLVGSAILVVYGILLNSIPFVILNTVWAAFSLKDVIRRK